LDLWATGAEYGSRLGEIAPYFYGIELRGINWQVFADFCGSSFVLGMVTN